ncbi:hypothetical protein [Yersinia phage fHe-Yen9-04]|uniref:N-acetyltransferase domain-containing protein n=2 Tax=Eneladusvirus Yen904 TaxID=2560849 RepID=A0A2C9CXQ2_9CAUD|nr:hypothetical protein FDJ41_gp481 [Yersinia phage fHe-Yen9-04]SOK58699.1 hypothetical protein [Yersinia phage fHe-Yen9-04]SOK59233.1 hypothetical protein [Yersinia phage fHe-Yen9-03]VUE36468.1 hypothetical protein [Yersinia phage fHe-Yen9-04]
MKTLTTSDFKIQELSKMCIDSHLFHSYTWTMFQCFNDVIDDDEIAKNSEIIILQDDFGKNIGAIFHNDENHYFGTNIQVFVLESKRGNGYGKFLYKEMNKFLIKQKFDGTLYAGSGIVGSMDFWDKMSKLHESTECLELHAEYF